MYDDYPYSFVKKLKFEMLCFDHQISSLTKLYLSEADRVLGFNETLVISVKR